MNSPFAFQKAIPETMAPFEPTQMEVDSAPAGTGSGGGNFSDSIADNDIAEGEVKFQKEIKLSHYVPYRDHLNQSRSNLWNNLKSNLCEAIVKQGTPLQEWIYACDQ